MLEATQKSKQHADATTMTMMEETQDETEDRKGPMRDLLGYMTMGEDRRIKEVYGDWIYSNNGAHLSGGVEADQEW